MAPGAKKSRVHGYFTQYQVQSLENAREKYIKPLPVVISASKKPLYEQYVEQMEALYRNPDIRSQIEDGTYPREFVLLLRAVSKDLRLYEAPESLRSSAAFYFDGIIDGPRSRKKFELWERSYNNSIKSMITQVFAML